MFHNVLEAGPSGRVSQKQKGPSIAWQSVSNYCMQTWEAAMILHALIWEVSVRKHLLTAFMQDLLDVQHARCCLLSWSEVSVNAADSSAKQDRWQEGYQQT
jgi:hypothetical protein